MNVVHISEEEAVRDFARVLAKLDAGDAVVIDRASRSVELRQATLPAPRSVSEIVSGMPDHTEGVIDADWADDLEALRERHSERPDASLWG